VNYHGNVTVGGPPDVRELAELVITKVAVGPYDNNAYLLRCRYTDHQLLIDAAAEPKTLIRLVNGSLEKVVTTHQHGDHWQALAEVVEATGAETLAGRLDAEGIPVDTQRLVDDGDVIEIGRGRLRAIHLVGHTPGSIALLYDDPKGHPHLFTGDCLFPGGPGRTTHPTDFDSLMTGLETKIFDVLPDETWIYPGHGKDSTVGDERPHLGEWRARGW
jgi:glyoxylase-like metal-dependent hydrolase (beta-lactamase superfamily II)